MMRRQQGVNNNNIPTHRSSPMGGGGSGDSAPAEVGASRPEALAGLGEGLLMLVRLCAHLLKELGEVGRLLGAHHSLPALEHLYLKGIPASAAAKAAVSLEPLLDKARRAKK